LGGLGVKKGRERVIGRKEEYRIESLIIIKYHKHEDYQKVKTELAMVFD
jgi:hypothetical protein